MARLNIYLPDELAERARAAKLNISALTQSAIEAELVRQSGLGWLSQVAALPATSVDHDAAMAAISAARAELAGDEHA